MEDRDARASCLAATSGDRPSARRHIRASSAPASPHSAFASSTAAAATPQRFRRNPRPDGSAHTRAEGAGHNGGWPDWAGSSAGSVSRTGRTAAATPASLQLVGVLHGMACLMAENGHAFGPGAALDVEHHLLLELHQTGMGEIEGNGYAGHIRRAEPFVRYPCVRPQPDAPLFELFVERVETILEPGAFDPTLRLLRRRLSNCSSDSFSQAYFRRGIGFWRS